MPPAPVCSDANTVALPPVQGTCATNACSYATSPVVCSSGCLGGGCLREADLSERAIVMSAATLPTPVRFALDRGNQPRAAICANGVVSYRYRGPTGWRTVTVESGLGNCEAALAIDSSNRAHIVYRNATAGQIRIADETAPETFTLDVVSFSDGTGLSIAMMPDDSPVIAYGAPPTGNRQLYVARRSPGWTSTPITGTSGAATELVIGPGGAIHLLGGLVARRSGDAFAPVFYAHTATGGAWEVHTIAQSMMSLHALALDAQGSAMIVTRTQDPTTPGIGANPVVDVLWTHGPNGLLAERIARTSDTSFALPPFLLPNAHGETRVIYYDGTARRKLAWEHWVTTPTAIPSSSEGVVDAAVGSDRAPRLLTTPTAAVMELGVVTPLCRPACAGSGVECGSDGCGGVCGACTGGCLGCGDNGRCAQAPSERILRPGTEVFPAYQAAVNGAFRLANGSILVGREQNTVMVGNTNQWTTMSASIGSTAGWIAGGGQIYLTSTAGVYRWTGSAFTLHASVGLPTSHEAAVDGNGDVHLAYTDAGQDNLFHRTVTAAGVVGAEETVRTRTGSSNLGVQSIAATGAGIVHIVFGESGVSQNRHLVQEGPGAPWVLTSPPGISNFIGDGAVDASGTYWTQLGFLSGFGGAGLAYAVRTPDGQWTYPTFSTAGTAFTSRVLPEGLTFIPSPDGRMYAKAGNALASSTYYQIDRAADTTTRIISNLASVSIYAAIDGAGTLHLFGVESPNQVQNVRHWWRAPTP